MGYLHDYGNPHRNDQIPAASAAPQEQRSFWRHFGRTVEFLPDEELEEMDLLEALSEAGRLEPDVVVAGVMKERKKERKRQKERKTERKNERKKGKDRIKREERTRTEKKGRKKGKETRDKRRK